MKLYTYDRGPFGMSVAIAETAEEALIAIREEVPPGYGPESVDKLIGYEIKPGLVIDNLGDA